MKVLQLERLSRHRDQLMDVASCVVEEEVRKVSNRTTLMRFMKVEEVMCLYSDMLHVL